MANTTNFGWETPDDTDLVKDGAAAMRTLGNSIDASFIDLKGGTTGQILSKASNTDLDYTWINNDQGDITEVVAGTGISGGGTSGSVTITNSMATAIDAKGDLVAGTGADTFARLAVGSNNQVLTADSSTATGLKWAAAASGGITNWSLLNAGGTALTGAQTITISGISNQKAIWVQVDNYASSASASSTIAVRINGDTANNYIFNSNYIDAQTTYSTGNFVPSSDPTGTSFIKLFRLGNVVAATGMGSCFIEQADQTGWKRFYAHGSGSSDSSAAAFHYSQNQGLYKGSAAITSISVFSSIGNFDAGTVYVYGAS